MSYELAKPCAETQRVNFIIEHNHHNGLRIEDTELYLFALEPNEIMGEKEIEIDVPDYEDIEEEYTETILEYETIEQEYEAPLLDEEGNQVYRKEEQEIEEPIFDEQGNPVLDEEGNPTYETKTIEIDIPETEIKTREVTVPKMEEYTETITVTELDDEGNETTREETVTKQRQVSHEETKTRIVTKQVGSHTETIIIPYPVVNENYEEELAEEREKEFNLAFFDTSLGYIRRKVTMKDGSKKDFLADLLLSIKAGLDMGLDVKILTYDKPPFDRDVEDWTEFQHEKSATAQFIAECLQQTVADFK